MNVILVGFMGTGKSAVGRVLAKRLGRRLIDVDQLIEARAGRSVAQVFAEQGEPYFRRRERAAIRWAARQSHAVIATGGGAIIDPANLRVLRRAGWIVCLSASVQTLLRRLGDAAHRPLLAGPDRRRRIVALLRQRRPAYAQADYTVDTTRRSVRTVVRLIEAFLAQSRWPRTTFGRRLQVCDLPSAYSKHARLLGRRYPGRYVALVDDHVVAVGRSRCDVYREASGTVPAHASIGVVYVPERKELRNITPLRIAVVPAA